MKLDIVTVRPEGPDVSADDGVGAIPLPRPALP